MCFPRAALSLGSMPLVSEPRRVSLTEGRVASCSPWHRGDFNAEPWSCRRRPPRTGRGRELTLRVCNCTVLTRTPLRVRDPPAPQKHRLDGTLSPRLRTLRAPLGHTVPLCRYSCRFSAACSRRLLPTCSPLVHSYRKLTTQGDAQRHFTCRSALPPYPDPGRRLQRCLCSKLQLICDLSLRGVPVGYSFSSRLISCCVEGHLVIQCSL